MSFMKLQQVKQKLNDKFYDRDVEIEALLIALLSKQHILFIGPAGTGKSALSSMLGEIVEDSSYFQHLLTPFSTPEELFGVLSLKDLEQGVYMRNIKGMLPEANFAFIDEIFKANSAILNSLLTLINERIFYNNGVPVPTPLMSIIGSSNEYIEEGEGLEALFDRFLLRYEIDYIRDDKQFIAMLQNNAEVQLPKLSMQELVQHQHRVKNVNISQALFETIAKIRKQLQDEGIRPSDRRFKQSLSLIQAKAYLEGRFDVLRSDLKILTHTLWETIEQKEQVKLTINSIAFDRVEEFINRISPQFNSIVLSAHNLMLGHHNPAKKLELSKLLMEGKSLFLEVQSMNRQVPNREELLHLKEQMHRKLLQITTEVIGF